MSFSYHSIPSVADTLAPHDEENDTTPNATNPTAAQDNGEERPPILRLSVTDDRTDLSEKVYDDDPRFFASTERATPRRRVSFGKDANTPVVPRNPPPRVRRPLSPLTLPPIFLSSFDQRRGGGDAALAADRGSGPTSTAVTPVTVPNIVLSDREMNALMLSVKLPRRLGKFISYK
ncbi:hypothetical protein AGDE_16348 [Angomonas deanei]|uniref:Uncharacterized protein n=1 Tax=Angomonas deanei TaxID=59799 RepID=A0A7G2C388_9TRYP|nr:hypothetical protein AGDE_16348 [Angomonas deanei]CAD2213975.1 hypothetical protein, conserved [Angomonas deanei]|eukprot:EPY17267.1 hypothetical protein AGDE_16348 [Angomonas deanei]